jgi:flagellar hook-associated protein 2
MINLNITPGSTDTGNGIDVTSVVNQILSAERAPEALMQQQQARVSSQVATLNSLNSGLAYLLEKVNDLKDVVGALTAMQANSSNTGILTASAQASTPAGNHVIFVQNLVTTASYYTDSLAGPDTTFGTGTISVQIGSGAGSTSVSIPIDSSTNTLNKLVAYISSHDLGLTASVIQDATGSRLALVSQTAGSSGDLTVTANSTGLVFHKSSTGQNAALTIDGVPVSSTSNVIAGALTGVTLNLASAAPGIPVQLTVSPDTARAQQAVNDFVSAYNSVTTAINNQFAVNETTHSPGVLAGNSSLRSLQSSLLSDVTYSISGNKGLVNLASIGVNMANDGTLSVDSSKLSDAVTSQFSDFQNLFQSLSQNGLALNFAADLKQLTDSTRGSLNLNLTELASTQRMLQNQINDFEDRMTQRQKVLINQYSRVDTMLRQFPLIMAQITGQLGVLSSK